MNCFYSAFLSPKQFDEVHALWNAEYPVKLKDRLILLMNEASKTKHFYFCNESNEIIAWSVLFEKEKDLRFSIIVSRKYQHQQLGSKLLDEMKKEKLPFSGWVIDHDADLLSDGTNYRSPLAFYVKNHFQIDETCRLNTEMIKAELVRYQPEK